LAPPIGAAHWRPRRAVFQNFSLCKPRRAVPVKVREKLPDSSAPPIFRASRMGLSGASRDRRIPPFARRSRSTVDRSAYLFCRLPCSHSIHKGTGILRLQNVKCYCPSPGTFRSYRELQLTSINSCHLAPNSNPQISRHDPPIRWRSRHRISLFSQVSVQEIFGQSKTRHCVLLSCAPHPDLRPPFAFPSALSTERHVSFGFGGANQHGSDPWFPFSYDTSKENLTQGNSDEVYRIPCSAHWDISRSNLF
jgi:hypothetical protein